MALCSASEEALAGAAYGNGRPLWIPGGVYEGIRFSALHLHAVLISATHTLFDLSRYSVCRQQF
jgi:hypothetical protein